MRSESQSSQGSEDAVEGGEIGGEWIVVGPRGAKLRKRGKQTTEERRDESKTTTSVSLFTDKKQKTRG